MGLWENIEWDIDEEKQKNKINAEKILKEFPNVEGLKDVLDSVQALMDSEIYDKVYETSKNKEGKLRDETVEDLLELPQVNYATKVLKDPPLYVASLTGVIISSHFIATVSMIDFITYAYKQEDLSQKDLNKNHSILERLMSSLNNFNTVKEYKVPDEKFYKKLKQIKWDKQGKKLFNKINGIRRDITIVKWVSDASTFGTGENFALTFLAACNSVNQSRNKILTEDVIIAYKAYFKLLNTDISKLM